MTKKPEFIKKDLKEQLLKHMYWEDIYTLFKNYHSNGPIITFLKEQFTELMEGEGMSPYEKINEEMVNGYNSIIENMKKLFRRIIQEFRSDKVKIETYKISMDWIDQYFIFGDEKIKCSLTFLREDKKIGFYIDKESLTKNEVKKLLEENFEKKGTKWLSIEYSLNSLFWESDSQKQYKTLKNFFRDQFLTFLEIHKKTLD